MTDNETITQAIERLRTDEAALSLLKDLWEVDEIQIKRMSKEEIATAERLRDEQILIHSLGYPSYKLSPAGEMIMSELINDNV